MDFDCTSLSSCDCGKFLCLLGLKYYVDYWIGYSIDGWPLGLIHRCSLTVLSAKIGLAQSCFHADKPLSPPSPPLAPSSQVNRISYYQNHNRDYHHQPPAVASSGPGSAPSTNTSYNPHSIRYQVQRRHVITYIQWKLDSWSTPSSLPIHKVQSQRLTSSISSFRTIISLPLKTTNLEPTTSFGPGAETFPSAIGVPETISSRRSKVQRVCCMALCGIHLGSLRYLSSSTFVPAYIQVSLFSSLIIESRHLRLFFFFSKVFRDNCCTGIIWIPGMGFVVLDVFHHWLHGFRIRKVLFQRRMWRLSRTYLTMGYVFLCIKLMCSSEFMMIGQNAVTIRLLHSIYKLLEFQIFVSFSFAYSSSLFITSLIRSHCRVERKKLT